MAKKFTGSVRNSPKDKASISEYSAVCLCNKHAKKSACKIDDGKNQYVFNKTKNITMHHIVCMPSSSMFMYKLMKYL